MECNCPEETIEHKTDFSFSNGSFFWSAVDLANPWEKTDMNTYVNNESGTTRLDSANIWLEESTMTFNESGFRTEITIYTLEGSCTFINDNVIVK